MERAMEAIRNACKVIETFRAKYSIAETIYRIGGQFRTLTDGNNWVYILSLLVSSSFFLHYSKS